MLIGEELFMSCAKEEELDRYPRSAKYGENLFRVHISVRGLRRHKYKRQGEPRDERLETGEE